MPPFVIPFFIVHQGCPHRCVFCNQQGITGTAEQNCRAITVVEVREQIEAWLSRPRRHPERQVQVAFYGGTFTGLSRQRQEELLGAVRPFIDKGLVHSIRISTRPDGVDDETGGFLNDHGVRTVELGVQSLDEKVLQRSGRDYSPVRVEQAFAMLKKAGLRVGGQLMIGLPGETTVQALAGARRLAALRPDCVRIYPTLVVRGSELAELYQAGNYCPLSLNKAVALTARLKEIFAAHNIPVIRMGLQPGTSLEESLLAGPYHPAFGELVLSRLLFKKTRQVLAGVVSEYGPLQTRKLCIAAADQSLFRGQRNASFNRLQALGLLQGVETVFSPHQARHTVEFQVG